MYSLIVFSSIIFAVLLGYKLGLFIEFLSFMTLLVGSILTILTSPIISYYLTVNVYNSQYTIAITTFLTFLFFVSFIKIFMISDKANSILKNFVGNFYYHISGSFFSIINILISISMLLFVLNLSCFDKTYDLQIKDTIAYKVTSPVYTSLRIFQPQFVTKKLHDNLIYEINDSVVGLKKDEVVSDELNDDVKANYDLILQEISRLSITQFEFAVIRDIIGKMDKESSYWLYLKTRLLNRRGIMTKDRFFKMFISLALKKVDATQLEYETRKLIFAVAVDYMSKLNPDIFLYVPSLEKKTENSGNTNENPSKNS